ncbi:MAG: M28 family peptidase [Planctomycetota bacterium]|jgi:hypothetical protein
MKTFAAMALSALVWSAGPPAGVEDDPLGRALAALDTASVAADLAFLADPELGGRGTATPEAEVAALYVESRVRHLGLAPGSTDGYRPRFPLARRGISAEESLTRLVVDGEIVPLALGRDTFLRGSVDTVDVDASGPVVAVGIGDKRSLERAGDLAGSWALLADRGRGTLRAITRSMEAGALGVLLTPAADYTRDSYAERYAASTAEALEGRLSSPLSSPPGGPGGPPVLLLTRDATARIAASLEIGIESLLEPGTRPQVHMTERRVVEQAEITSPNVAALLRGKDPRRSDELIVLCAHLDHLGRRRGELYPGADDNASGSVGLLALADAIVERGAYDRSILFLWVTGEEAGLWGSAAWCADPRLPAGLAPVAAFNLDMIGRDAPETLWWTPTSRHPEHNALAALVPDLAPSEGFSDLVSQDSYWSASDHYSFANALRIPVVYLSSGEHDDYHEPTDTADRIDLDKLLRVVRLHLRLFEAAEGVDL